MFDVFSRERLCIDIRGRLLKYMQVSCCRQKSAITVRKYGCVLFDEAIAQHGNMTGNDETVKVIANLVKKEKLMAKNVYLNISGPSIVLRIIEVPFMSARDLKDYLSSEIYRYLPVDLSTSVYDYRILDSFESDGKKKMNVMLASVPSVLVKEYMNIMKKAGLNLRVIDVYPNSLARLFKGCDGQSVAVVDINENSVDLVIFDEGKLFMYSSVMLENKIPLYEKRCEYFGRMLESDEVFLAALGEVTGYIRTYMNFFSSRHFGRNVDMMHILGEITMMKDVAAYFANELQLDVRAGLPEQFSINMHVKMSDMGSGLDSSRMMSMYPCNIGLALKEI